MVDSYRIIYSGIDPNKPDSTPLNQLKNTARVYTPEDKTVQTPNSDTPYSSLTMDLRAEPLVLTVPAVDTGRYFSIQLIDLYTHNFAYIGTRATGNDGGNFLIAGPNWKGEKPQGIKEVIRTETELAKATYRTQLFNAGDIEKVKKIQAGYRVQPLSAFLKQPAPPAAPKIEFIKALTSEEQKTSLEFFNVLNFVLQFCPTHPSEKDLMARFAKINVGAGKKFDAASLSPEMRKAIEIGRADAWAALADFQKRMDAKEVTAGELFGTREYLTNNYLYRMAGAILGIYGNSKEEAMYPFYTVDENGQKLNGGNRYTIRFEPGKLPPVNAFWSLTMYELPSSLLTPNPINRYLINSPMLPQLKKDADGGYTLYVQHDPPGKEKESNWLPAPSGPFFMAMRLYLPRSEAANGSWREPQLKVEK